MRIGARVRATAGTFGTAATIETDSVEETMIGSGILTKQIASYLARTGYEALNDEALRATKDHILYTLGTILAGSSAPGIEQALAGARALSGGSQESTVLVRGDKLPAAFAALVNATMGHSRELDINDDRIAYKSSITVVPAALATAEKVGHVSGKDLLAAVVSAPIWASALGSRLIRSRFTPALSRSGRSRPPPRAAKFSAWTKPDCITRSASPFVVRQSRATARRRHP
jgi:MmgE/PrpD N-terminal domain